MYALTVNAEKLYLGSHTRSEDRPCKNLASRLIGNREGILFQNAHTSSPVCNPSRCSLLTGVHTPIHGVIENGGKRRNDLPVFPDLLKEVGYINIVSGKTHFGDVPEFFDINYATSGSDLYERHLKEHGFDKPKTHPNPVPEDLFYDAFVTSNTIKGIEEAQRNSDAPFFAFCSMIAPHYPLIPPGRWADLYTDEMLPHRHRSGTGRVSLQAGELIKSVCGTDAEERLNKKAQAIDEMFGDL